MFAPDDKSSEAILPPEFALPEGNLSVREVARRLCLPSITLWQILAPKKRLNFQVVKNPPFKGF